VNFINKLQKSIAKNNSLLCVGLDPDPALMPKNKSIYQFNKNIIDQTHDLVASYKPNIAFYEAQGIAGLNELLKTINYLRSNYSQIPIILDAKRADIANTAKFYAKSAFEFWQADAITVYPHLGKDSLEPFLSYKDKLTIVLIKTSNPDSGMFQNLKIEGEPYYLKVAKEIKKWKYNNIGIFIGATYSKELKEIRKIFPDKIFLSAGLGAQDGDIKKAVQAGIDKNGQGIAYNASRSIIYSKNPKGEAQKLRDIINMYRNV